MTTQEIAEFVKSLRAAGLSESETASALQAKMAEDREQERERKEALVKLAEAEAEMRSRVAVSALQTAVALYEIQERQIREYNSFGATLSRFFRF